MSNTEYTFWIDPLATASMRLWLVENSACTVCDREQKLELWNTYLDWHRSLGLGEYHTRTYITPCEFLIRRAITVTVCGREIDKSVCTRADTNARVCVCAEDVYYSVGMFIPSTLLSLAQLPACSAQPAASRALHVSLLPASLISYSSLIWQLLILGGKNPIFRVLRVLCCAARFEKCVPLLWNRKFIIKGCLVILQTHNTLNTNC